MISQRSYQKFGKNGDVCYFVAFKVKALFFCIKVEPKGIKSHGKFEGILPNMSGEIRAYHGIFHWQTPLVTL